MPTIALVNGHAFAGGFMLAMYHDYRVFNPTRGFLCLNELDLGVPLQAPMSSVFRQKVAAPQVYRSLVLEAKRFSAKEALETGIVDVLGALPEALALVAERALVGRPRTGVYGRLKREMWRETVAYLEGSVQEERMVEEALEREEVRVEEGRRRVEEWKRGVGKAKL
jgi:enoyl-CoA hydratase/carnithine racemase